MPYVDLMFDAYLRDIEDEIKEGGLLSRGELQDFIEDSFIAGYSFGYDTGYEDALDTLDPLEDIDE